MEKQKNNSVLITLIVILILLLLGSSGYILYDKGLIGKPTIVNNNQNKKDNDKQEQPNQEQPDNENKQNQSNDNNQSDSDKKEVNKLSSYEVECSYGLVPYIESLFVKTNVYDKDKGEFYLDFQKYNDKDSSLITSFLIHYLEKQALRNGFDSKINKEEYNGEFSLSVDKAKLDSITKKVFNTQGLNDYSVVYREKFGLIKLSDNYYKLSWFATGGSGVTLSDISVDIADDKAYMTVSAELGSASGYSGNIGSARITINLNRNDRFCYIEKIEKLS